MPIVTPDFRPLDIVACPGDSLTGPAAGNGVSWVSYADALVRPSFTGRSAPGGGIAAPGYLTYYRGPTFINFGVAGDTTTNVLARLAPIYAVRPTGVILLCEDNDVTNGVPVATYSSNITSIVAGLRANCGPQLRWVHLVQSPCIGELRPFGSNSNDTTPPAADADHTLEAKDQVLRTLAASLSTGLTEFRTDAAGNGAWLDYETLYNTTNFASQFITIDGRHLTSAPGGSDPPAAGIGGGPFVAQRVLANSTVVP